MYAGQPEHDKHSAAEKILWVHKCTILSSVSDKPNLKTFLTSLESSTVLTDAGGKRARDDALAVLGKAQRCLHKSSYRKEEVQ